MAQEKLIVKNFGPIKDAEIELGKVTVFIGEQASGKSVLAKLVAILKDFNLPKNKTESDFQDKIGEYNIQSFANKSSYIIFENDFYKETYASNKFNVENKNDYEEVLENVLSKTKTYAEKVKEFSENISSIAESLSKVKEGTTALREDVNKTKENTSASDEILKNNNDYTQQISDANNASDKILESLNEIRLNLGKIQPKLIMDELQKKTVQLLHYPVYIPAERILISLISSTLISFINNNIFLPKYILKFAELYNNAKLSGVATSGLDFFKYELENDIDYIQYNNSKTKLSESSTGLQSLVPLVLAIEYEKSEMRLQNRTPFFPKNFIIEEPELSLYPINQKKLVNYLVESCTQNNDHLILTTHSPYILSSLDNLIQAGNVVKKHPELKEEVEKIIPSQYHLNYEDVKVYFVGENKKTGKHEVRLIMNEEYQGIDVNELDVVSENLNEEFEKLLDLKYQD